MIPGASPGNRNRKRSDMVTEKMREAGSKMASDLMDAQVLLCLAKPSGNLDWEEFEAYHGSENIDIIKQCCNGEIDSVTAIYIAMHRESITEKI